MAVPFVLNESAELGPHLVSHRDGVASAIGDGDIEVRFRKASPHQLKALQRFGTAERSLSHLIDRARHGVSAASAAPGHNLSRQHLHGAQRVIARHQSIGNRH
jgi:hypothetical protein